MSIWSISFKIDFVYFQNMASDLQRSVLDFTKRLHSVEVERRDLRTEVGRIRSEQHKHIIDEQNQLRHQVLYYASQDSKFIMHGVLYAH